MMSSSSPARKIKVLCCTANIGNQEPDVESLNAWIPKNGRIDQVVDNQQYPLGGLGDEMRKKFQGMVHALVVEANENGEVQLGDDSTGDDDDEAEDDNTNLPRFDIIAIGMQEATFELPDEKRGLILKNVKKVKDVVGSSDYKESKSNFGGTIGDYVKGEKEKVLKKLLSKSSSVKSSKQSDHDESKPNDAKTKNDSDRLMPINEPASTKNLLVETNLEDEDTRFLHLMLSNHLPSYTRAVSYQRGQMRLLVFYNEPEITLDVLGVKAQNTGVAGLANKGGIVAECNVNSGTRISFLSAHLEAHEGISKYNMRCSTLADILRGTSSSATDFGCDVSLSSHFCFVMGDLNFRTRLPVYEPGSEKYIEEAHNLVKSENWRMLNECDELSKALKKKDCLVGFQTPECNFPPTFKVLRNDGYAYNPKRSPSYTDRILHKGNHLLSNRIEVLAYGPIDHFTTSDHKPMRGAYDLQLNIPLRWRPVLVRGNKSI